jgi:hypothetical protein
MFDKFFFLILISIFFIPTLLLFIIAPLKSILELYKIKKSLKDEQFFQMIRNNGNILISGEIAENNKPLAENFIIAQSYEYRDAYDGYVWEKNNEYKQDFFIKTGNQLVLIKPLKLSFKGKFVEWVNPENEDRKIKGFVTGDCLTVQGKIISETPLTVETKYYFGGKINEYISYTKDTRNLILIFTGIPFLITLVIFIIRLLIFFQE